MFYNVYILKGMKPTTLKTLRSWYLAARAQRHVWQQSIVHAIATVFVFGGMGFAVGTNSLAPQSTFVKEQQAKVVVVSEKSDEDEEDDLDDITPLKGVSIEKQKELMTFGLRKPTVEKALESLASEPAVTAKHGEHPAAKTPARQYHQPRRVDKMAYKDRQPLKIRLKNHKPKYYPAPSQIG